MKIILTIILFIIGYCLGYYLGQRKLKIYVRHDKIPADEAGKAMEKAMDAMKDHNGPVYMKIKCNVEE